jgi:outer membrane protein TolC
MVVRPLRWRVSAPRRLLVSLFALLSAVAAHAAQDRVPLNLRLSRTATTTPDNASLAVAQRAGTGASLSLDGAARIAAAHAPQVQANQYRIEAARQDAVRAGRLPDPMLTAGINNLTVTGPQAFNAAADEMTMRQLGITQEIPSHTRRAAEKQVAEAGVRLANANEVSLRLATQEAAASAWVALWTAQQERSLLSELRGQDQLAIEVSKARLAGGMGTATAVLAARADAEALANQIDAADAAVAAARAGLQRWLGEAADRSLGDPPDFSTLRVPEARLEAKLDQQAALLTWGPREEQADAAVALARAGKHPDFSVSLMYGERINRPDMLAIEFGVSLPLFPGNRQDRNISARYADRAAVRAEFEDARRAQRQAVAQAVADWQGWNRQVRRFRKQLLPLAADRSRTALTLYRGGGSLEPWLEARRDEIRTRVDYAKALSAWGKAWVALAYLLPDQDNVELPQ